MGDTGIVVHACMHACITAWVRPIRAPSGVGPEDRALQGPIRAPSVIGF